MKRVLIAAALGLFAVVTVPAACADDAGDAAVKIKQVQVKAGPVPQIQLITGLATNVTGHRIAMVTLTFKLYDATGLVVGSPNAQTFNLDPGETWRFEAPTTVAFDKTVLANVSVQ